MGPMSDDDATVGTEPYPFRWALPPEPPTEQDLPPVGDAAPQSPLRPSLPDRTAPPPPSPRRGRLVALLVATALLAGTVGGVVGARIADEGDAAVTATPPPAARPPAAGGPTGPSTLAGALDVRTLLAQVEPSVVAIRTGGSFRTGTGSGVLLSADGEVLTNAHVVEGSSALRVTLNGESQSRPAVLVGADEGHDLALLRITGAEGLPVAKLGRSADLQVGDDVVAIGNALGLRGAPTVTRGIVSALDRTLDNLTGLIQTDAAINPGNSGGPLVNAAGQVVGINTAISGAGQNIGFAIPIDQALPIIDRLRTGASAPAAGYLGVALDDPPDGSRGALIVEIVPGSPADAAGLRPGDVVTSLGGKEVDGAAEAAGQVRDHRPGEEIEIDYQRDGRSGTTRATLVPRPSA